MSASSRLLIASLLLSAWLGGALLTVAVVAPGAFAVLPTRTMAGEMVGRVLGVVFVSGLVVGIAVAMAAGAGRTSPGAAITALLASAACAVAQFGINPRIAQIRSAIGGPVDLLPLDDARRVAFGLLHGYSVAGLGVAMLSAAVSLGFLLVALRPRS
jgi:hypothetical protein